MSTENRKQLFRDPVCGMDIEPSTAAGKVVYKGQTIYFCSKHCETEFKKNPAKYLPSLKK